MNNNEGFFARALKRRIPQYLAAYIAGTWLLIELGEWAAERFAFSPVFTSYLFLISLMMLPAFLLLVYNHGEAGKQRWTRLEKFFVPLNLLVAAAVVGVGFPDLGQVEAATRIAEIEDETGQIQQVVVANQDHYQFLFGFFIENKTGDSSLDWASYGLTQAITKDLRHVSPVIGTRDPLDSDRARASLLQRGDDNLISSSRSLQFEIANSIGADHFFSGSLERQGDQLALNIAIVKRSSGETISEFSVRDSALFVLADQASDQIQSALNIEPAPQHQNLTVAEHFTDSELALEKYIQAKLAVAQANDYPAGVQFLEAALQQDPDFAEAAASLSIFYFLSGNQDQALSNNRLALNKSYRLTSASKYTTKAQSYVFSGDFSKAIKVLKMHSEIEPRYYPTWRTLFGLSQLSPGEEGLVIARQALERIAELRPWDDDNLKLQATLEQRQKDYPAAERSLEIYLEKRPDDGLTMIELAELKEMQGKLKESISVFEKAAILPNSPSKAEVGRARVLSKSGDSKTAISQLDSLRSAGLSNQENLDVLNLKTQIYAKLGQPGLALASNQAAAKIADQTLSPIEKVLTQDSYDLSLMALSGNTDKVEQISAVLESKLTQFPTIYLDTILAAIYSSPLDEEKFIDTVSRIEKEESSAIVEFFYPFIARKYALMGDSIKAQEFIDKAEETIDKDLLQTRALGRLDINANIRELAKAYFAVGDFDAAYRILTDNLQRHPADPETLLLLAQTAFEQNNTAEAEQRLQQALEIWGEADSSWYPYTQAQAFQNQLSSR